jgi:hypothetical protein
VRHISSQLRSLTQTRHSFFFLSGSGLIAAACQSNLALVVSMRICNTGESLSRPFPRLQRTRQRRGRASHSDFKRRTFQCPPFPYRTASGIPPLLPAATPVSDPSTCWRRLAPYIHGHRDTFTTPNPSLAPSLHVATLSIVLQRGLSAAPANRRTQAQSPGRLAARSHSRPRAAAQPVRTSNRKRLTTTRDSELLHSTVPAAAHPAFYSTSNPPPPSTKHSSQ